MSRLTVSRGKLVVLLTFASLVCVVGTAQADFTFGEVTNLGPVVNGPAGDAATCFSADGLEMYFDSHRAGGHGGWDVYVTRRKTIDDGWSAPVNLGPPVNTAHEDYCANISANGLELYFTSDDRAGGHGGADIWVVRRATTDDEWGSPVNLGSIVNSSAVDIAPRLSVDGLELYFSSARSGGHGSTDIWVTRRTTLDDPWEAPVNLGPPVNSEASECYPFLSADGLLLLFSENDGSPLRPGGRGDIDNWAAWRTSLSDPWETPVNLGSAVNSPSLDGGPVLSPDHFTLYFSSARSGSLGGMWGDTWQASIIPVVDFDGDGQVDGSDVLRMADRWGTDDPLCDIGPMPWGDGIVDTEDLKALAEYVDKEVIDGTLMAHYALGETEGDIAYDSSFGNHGLVRGEALWKPQEGVIGGALEFDGVDDCIETSRVIDRAGGPLSVLAWVKGGGPSQVIISTIDGSNWLFGSVSNREGVGGNLRTEFGPDALTSNTVITDGQWHRIALVWDGTSRTLYVDNVPVAEDAPADMQEDKGRLYIGCGADQSPDSFFSGLIDDIRIYNRAVRP